MYDVSLLEGQASLLAGDVLVVGGVVVEQGSESNPRLPDLLLALIRDQLECDRRLCGLLQKRTKVFLISAL